MLGPRLLLVWGLCTLHEFYWSCCLDTPQRPFCYVVTSLPQPPDPTLLRSTDGLLHLAQLLVKCSPAGARPGCPQGPRHLWPLRSPVCTWGKHRRHAALGKLPITCLLCTSVFRGHPGWTAELALQPPGSPLAFQSTTGTIPNNSCLF